MTAVPIDRANKTLSKKWEKCLQENQEYIFHYENENTENLGGRLQYHRLRQWKRQFVFTNGVQIEAHITQQIQDWKTIQYKECNTTVQSVHTVFDVQQVIYKWNK